MKSSCGPRRTSASCSPAERTRRIGVPRWLATLENPQAPLPGSKGGPAALDSAALEGPLDELGDGADDEAVKRKGVGKCRDRGDGIIEPRHLDHRIEPEPFHVTYTRMPSNERGWGASPDLGLRHNRAYWVSDIEIRDDTALR